VAELRASGFLATNPGIGMVVTIPRGDAMDHLTDYLRPACEALLREARLMNAPLDQAIEILRQVASEEAYPAYDSLRNKPPST
jgi:GntR family transcriptional regulator